MSDSMEDARRRAFQYWNVDGLAEIGIGSAFFLIGLVLWGTDLLPAGPVRALATAFGFPVIFLGGMWLGGRLMKSLKERLTYPRTGFVSYHKPSLRRRWISLLAAVVFTLVLLVLTNIFQQGILSWMPFIEGVLLGLLFIYMAQGLWRFYLLAMLSFVVGTGLTWARLNIVLGQAAFYACMGGLVLVSGLLTLRSYLHQTQPEESGAA